MLDVHRGVMTWRRLRVIVEHLPPESHTMTALRNTLSGEDLAEQAEQGEPEKGRWSQVEQLLAMVADRVARVEHTLLCVNSEKNKQPPPPEPIRRPGAAPPKRKTKASLNEDGAERLFQLINGGAS